MLQLVCMYEAWQSANEGVVIIVHNNHWLIPTGTESCAVNPYRSRSRQQESEYPQANMQANTLTYFSILLHVGFSWISTSTVVLRAVSPAEESAVCGLAEVYMSAVSVSPMLVPVAKSQAVTELLFMCMKLKLII